MAKAASSTYEAKARFSELLRAVRAGKSITVLYRGEPAAELRPLPPDEGLARVRLRALQERGQLQRAASAVEPLRPAPDWQRCRVGALRRYMEDSA